MRNIEIKLFVDSFGGIVDLLESMEADFVEELSQLDAYFEVSKGRLKLREINGEVFQLIYYLRPDTEESKLSDYQIVSLDQSQCEGLKSLLRSVHGEKVVVQKKRVLWRYQNTRIHLDEVEGLGAFVELETVLDGIDFPQGEEEHQMVFDSLCLDAQKKVYCSYCDLMMEV